MVSARKALFWKLLERGGAKGLRLLIQIVLARILAPEEFGLLAILLVFVSLGDILISGGLGSSLIQMPDAKRVDYSTAFWLSTGCSFVVFIILIVFSPTIASFYNQPGLTVPLAVLALQFFPLSFNNIQVAKTTRSLDTKPIFVAVICAEVLAGVVALVLAYCGFGLWSLVLQQLLSAVAACFFTALQVKWRPYFEFSKESARTLLSFGLRVMMTDFLNNGATSAYTLVIGKAFTPSQLGYYSQGQRYPLAISEVLTSALTPVLLASFSKKGHEDLSALLSSTRGVSKLASIIMTPATFLAILFADTIIWLLLTDKWLPCVPFFQLYCLASLTRSITLILRQSIMATGDAGSPFKVAIFKLITSIVLLGAIVLAGGDLAMVAVGWVGACLVEQAATMAYASKAFDYKIVDQCSDLFPGVLCAAACCFVYYLLNGLIPSILLAFVLVVGSFAFVVFYYKFLR